MGTGSTTGRTDRVNPQHTLGIMEYANSDKFEGEWLNDLRNGQGTSLHKCRDIERC